MSNIIEKLLNKKENKNEIIIPKFSKMEINEFYYGAIRNLYDPFQ